MHGRFLDQVAVALAVARGPVGAVQPVVDAVAQAVARMLRVAGDAHPADLCPAVGFQVAVAVLAEPQPGRFEHEHAAFHERERARHREPVEEHRAAVGAPVGVGVLEHDDAAHGVAFAAALDVAHVSLVLDHPEAAVGIEFEEDRVLHQRLGGEKLEAVAGCDAEGLQGVGGRQRRRRLFSQKTLGGKDYSVAFATNKYGFRDFGTPNAPIKILVLGDSFTADPNASNDRMWYVAMTKRLAQRLRRPASDFYVVAGGAGGWGTYQNLLLAEKTADQFKPDLFVLQFCGNDFQNNSYEWERNSIVRGQFMRRPFASLDLDKPRYATGVAGTIYRSLVGESRLFNRFDGMIADMQFKHYGGYTRPLPPQITARYERDSAILTKKLLAELRDVYRHIPAVMLNCSSKLVGPNRYWEALGRSAGFVTLGRPSAFLNSLKSSERDAIFITDGSHLSEEGNQRYGEVAGDEISSLGLKLQHQQ